MARNLLNSCVLFALASYASAQQYGPGGSGGNPYSGGNNPDSNGSGSGSSSNNPFTEGGFAADLVEANKFITAHAVLATIAFGIFFPFGSILVRLGSFPGVWLVHGLFQIFAYLCFIAAAGLGVFIAMHRDLLYNKHPIIGLLCLGLLFFQPFLGMAHHFGFKKQNKRTIWSYAHIWLGRGVITLGMINGGFGLQLTFAPRPRIIGYAVAVGIVWLIYMACAIYGETIRKRAVKHTAAQRSPPPYKPEADANEDGTRYA